MISLENTIEIAASPDQVWSVLSNLTRSPEYVPGIVSATMEDLTRVCFDTDGNEIREASGSRRALLPFSPLRTVQERFRSYGSSLTNALPCRTRLLNG
jgi:hypothetical protein